MLVFKLICAECGGSFQKPYGRGRPPARCGAVCIREAKRRRKHAKTQARLDARTPA